MRTAIIAIAIMALISHYPYPLVGYGAAPILGFGLDTLEVVLADAVGQFEVVVEAVGDGWANRELCAG